MDILSIGASQGAQSSGNRYSSKEVAAIDKDFAALLSGDNPEEFLKKITKNGMSSYWSWQLEELKKKITAGVMAEMGVTAEQIAKMSDQKRASVEDRILKEVERRIREMIEQTMEKKKGVVAADPAGSQSSPQVAETLDLLI